MVAMPRLTTQKTTGTTIISTSPMNQSLSGLSVFPTCGSRMPTAMPRAAPTTTWNHSWRIKEPNRDRRGALSMVDGVELVMALVLLGCGADVMDPGRLTREQSINGVVGATPERT